MKTFPRIIEPNSTPVPKKIPRIEGTMWQRYQAALDAAIAERRAKKEDVELLRSMLRQGREAGVTLQQLGKIFGVSRERIRQLLLQDTAPHAAAGDGSPGSA